MMPRRNRYHTTPENLILGYLQHRGAISRHRASTHFNVWNLPAIIHKLRKRGHTFTHKGKDKDLTYTLVKDPVSCPTML
jgi:hypothetical protein